MDFQARGDSLESKAQLQTPAGTVHAQLSYSPATKHYQAALHTSNLTLEKLASLQQRGGPVRGSLTANVSGQGTISDPQLTATLQIPQLQIGEQTVSDAKATADVAHHHANFTLDSVVAQGYVQAKGGLDLRDGYNADATVDVRALPLGPILTAYFPSATQDLHGQTEIHASLKGPLKDAARVEARVEIPTLTLAYKAVQIANEGPLQMDYRGGVATVRQAKIKGTGTELTVQGVIPVRSSTPWNLSAKGSVDASLFQVVSPDAHASGHVEINLERRGSSSQSGMQGEIRLVDTSFSTESLPISFAGVNGQFSISGNRVQINSLNGSAGGGTFSGQGFFAYGPQPSFTMDLHARGVRVRPNGLRSVVDGDLQLNGTPQNSTLSGQVLVDRLSFQKGADIAELAGQFSGDSAVRTPSAFENHMRLNVAIRSAENLNPTSSQFSIEGSANLNLTGTAANPVILGRVVLNGGELFFRGKRFEIQRGSIVFANPVHTEPVLNVYVKTVVEQYNITINFVGSVDRLRTNYTSDPALPPLDIINLLAFGQTTAEKASNASTPASLGAESALAQGVAGQVAKGVQGLTGISQLTLDPLAGNNQNPGAQVAIQQRVTGSILLTFSTDVTSTQRQSIQLHYQPERQWRLSVLRDEYGGYGIDVRLHKVF
jgi:translocation and assembly module TamB